MAALTGAASLIAVAVPAAMSLIEIAERLIGVAHALHAEGGTDATAAQITELRRRLDAVNARVQAVTFP